VSLKTPKTNATHVPNVPAEPPVTIDTVALAARLAEKARPEVGIYYIVRYPRNWRLYPLQKQVFGDLTHIDAWRQFVAPEIADAWSAPLSADGAELTRQLQPCHFAFPHGRVERTSDDEFTVLHADDLEVTGITRAMIERAFALRRTHWMVDPRETCMTDHRIAVRRILRIVEDWQSS
jgi:hypothetical protein